MTTAFPERLRIEMARRNLTQAEVGRALGRSQAAVSYWANGHREPSIGDLCALADYFGVSADYLLGRSENRPPHTREG